MSRSIPLVRPSLRLGETLTLDIVVAFDYNRLGNALEEEAFFIEIFVGSVILVLLGTPQVSFR